MYSHNIFRNESSYQKKGNQIDKYVFFNLNNRKNLRFYIASGCTQNRKSSRADALADTKNEKPTGDRPWYAVQQVNIDWRRYEKEEAQTRKISIIQH